MKIEKEHQIITIDIHPLIDDNVIPKFQEFLKEIHTINFENSYIVLGNDNYEEKPK